MSKYVKVFNNFRYNLGSLIEELDTLYPLDTYISDQINYKNYQSKTYAYHKNIIDLPQHIKESIEFTINFPVMDYFFLWNWKNSNKILEPHIDPIVKESFGMIRARISFFICLEGEFKLNFHNNITNEVIESVVYEPGNIVVLNNTQAMHSGKLLRGNKRSLSGYLNTHEINKLDNIPFVDIEVLMNDK